MPSIRSRLVCDGVIETVVPGHTRTSPPPVTRSTAVSDPAVIADPAEMRFPARTIVPEPLVTGTTAGSRLRENPSTFGGSNGDDFFPAVASPAGFNRTIKRCPAPSHEYP